MGLKCSALCVFAVSCLLFSGCGDSSSEGEQENHGNGNTPCEGCGEQNHENNDEHKCDDCIVDLAFQVPIPDAEGTDAQCSNQSNDFHTIDKYGNESTWFDCNNHQCTQSPLVQVCDVLENTDEKCSDNADNGIASNSNDVSVHKNFSGRYNNLVDCKDPSCFKNPRITVCANEAPKYEFGAECHDDLDNDGDGLKDCEDPDCLHARASACDLGTRKRVLFDNAHHQVAGGVDWIVDVTGRHPFPSYPDTENAWHGSLSSFGRDLLVSGNYIVETLIQNRTLSYGRETEVQDLKNYDIVVIVEPSSSFSDEEVSAIHEFVKAGGGVLFVADHASADRDGNGVDAVIAINSLLARLPGATSKEENPFGFYVLNGSFTKNSETVVASGADAHPVIDGANGKVVSTGMYGAAGFAVTDSAKVTPLLTEKSSTEAFAIAVTYEKGKIVAIGDSAIMGDGTNHLGLTLDTENGYIDTVHQNRALFLNAIDWLR